MAEVHGSCDDRFSGVREELERQLDGDELGASIAVDLDGETVVDLWGGYRDEQRTTPWTEDTIVNGWSTTKTVLALAALVLVERGELDVHAPVADYWPEFAARGKKDVRVRHLMSHTSGVSGWDPPFSIRDMYDWQTATERLAQQAPWWEPGTASGYHANNQGHLVGEVVRRITNTTFKQFVATEIARPLGADYQIGARESDWDRIAPVVPPRPSDDDPRTQDPESVMVKTFTGPVASARAANSPEWRRADLGALNGHTNARGLVRVLRVMSLGGEAGGVRLLSPETIDLVFDQQSDGVDLVLGVPFRFGIGYCLGSPIVPYVPEGRTFFWGGWGGSMIVMDLDRRLTIGYVMNRMAPGILGSDRSEAYTRAVYGALG
ncbi:CubicO group peptidase (beta-lactamase class C family) [Geodermatophilus bullaregiensis]|uniref:serine hydrolase domain-containing protein n=1 Tax=Geodermatophilus bullaregiensis TaxID=1564160 RepID=UPI00195A734D|nr:serine hydrolase domain-containing protein [Geodermatophilus bullaregiensis]MBM7806766.1 CubicO group peptidase (beta-lactamase class C family) [Geodermatophilus bullaregiensis]